MRGESVRHPATSIKKNGYLPSSVPLSLLSMDLLVLIIYKCPNFHHAIYQEWQMQFDFVRFYLDSLFHLPSSLQFLWFRAVQWQDALEILTSSARTNNYVFGAIFKIPLPLISKNKVVCQMAGFWIINSHFGQFQAMILWELERV